MRKPVRVKLLLVSTVGALFLFQSINAEAVSRSASSGSRTLAAVERQGQLVSGPKFLPKLLGGLLGNVAYDLAKAVLTAAYDAATAAYEGGTSYYHYYSGWWSAQSQQGGFSARLSPLDGPAAKVFDVL